MIKARSFLARTIARVSTLVVWTLGGLTVVFLLLAMNKMGSYRDLSSVVQHGGSVGAVISARVAASLPYLLGALATLAAAFGLLTIKAAVEKLWHDTVIAHRSAVQSWEVAYYCPTDRIVFIRTVAAVHWEPVEEMHRLLARDWPGGPG